MVINYVNYLGYCGKFVFAFALPTTVAKTLQKAQILLNGRGTSGHLGALNDIEHLGTEIGNASHNGRTTQINNT